MHNCRWPEAQISKKECYCNRLAKDEKNLAIEELKQIWNSAVAVAIVVVAILSLL